VIGIGRDLFLPSEEIAHRKEEDFEIEERPLAAWQRVYEGLPGDQIAEVEAIALDRSHFSSSKNQGPAAK
jgi:hypothetical protein